jgi:hypothetical protein
VPVVDVQLVRGVAVFAISSAPYTVALPCTAAAPVSIGAEPVPAAFCM